MRLRTVGVLVLLVAGCGHAADAQQPKALEQIKAAPSADDPVQMKATLIKLQVQVLERDREIGSLRAQVAELQLNALGAAVQNMDPAVKKALGLSDQKSAPQTPKP